MKKTGKKFCQLKKKYYLCSTFPKGTGAFSSAGSEHLPYKQRVGGSNPSTPTINKSRKINILVVLRFLILNNFVSFICGFGSVGKAVGLSEHTMKHKMSKRNAIIAIKIFLPLFVVFLLKVIVKSFI